jgi:hypothetical protein
MTDLPEIQSEGPPPDRHAERIISLMMRYLAQQNAQVWAGINAIIHDPFCRDGNPKAQRKMADRVKATGASFVQLEPAKRGKYKLYIHDMIGWDHVTDTAIGVNDDVSKPWLAAQFHIVEGCGHCLVKHYTRQMVYITTHSLVRVVQRWQARNIQDLIRVVETISNVAIKYILKVDDGVTNDWCKTPPDGIRVPFPNQSSVMVLKRYEPRPGLVVVTIF